MNIDTDRIQLDGMAARGLVLWVHSYRLLCCFGLGCSLDYLNSVSSLAWYGSIEFFRKEASTLLLVEINVSCKLFVGSGSGLGAGLSNDSINVGTLASSSNHSAVPLMLLSYATLSSSMAHMRAWFVFLVIIRHFIVVTSITFN